MLPTSTNVVGLLLPEPGFHEALRTITREAGTVLAYDETHTQVCGPGGLTRAWHLQPDIVTLGKSIVAGVPLGAYGMTEAIATGLEAPVQVFDGHPPVATGGTGLRKPALDGRRPRSATRGSHGAGLRAYPKAWGTPSRRHRGDN
ncbi:MAG: aminotransferase class III-fold pyridoxal phosphate-dependent enzyme [Fimbriimonadales bacterium]